MLLRKLNTFLGAYFRSRVPEFVLLFGNKFYLDGGDILGLSFALYEKGVVDMVRNNLREGDVFVDVGANIGYFTVIAAGALKGSGHVYAFEPDRENFLLMEKNVHANGFANVTLEQRVVSERTGPVRLFLSKYNRGDHRMYDPEASPAYREEEHESFDQHTLEDRRRAVPVPAVALDEYFGSRPAAYFVKIDVQGAEGAVLKGARTVLSGAPRAIVVMEFWPRGMGLSGIGADAAFAMLKEYGFSKIYRLDERPQKWSETTFDAFAAFYRAHERSSMYVCVAKEDIIL